MNVKKIRENAIMPRYGTEDAAGADICACIDSAVVVEPGETKLFPTGLVLEIPKGNVGLLFARSGISIKRGLAPANMVGVIDADYRGELIVALRNYGDAPQTILPNERIAQIMISPYVKEEFCEKTDELSSTARGTGGFGSTGRVDTNEREL